jgi:arylformamidase
LASLYRDFLTHAEIDAQYDAEKSVPDFMIYAQHYIEESERVRKKLRCKLNVAYGQTVEETLDIFPADHPDAPVFVFIHGGYWRSLSSREFSCVALGLHALGITTVVVNYALAPKVSIDEISRQARAAVAWVLRNIAQHGGDPTRVVVGGHSAGGQLTAMCLTTDWAGDYGLTAHSVRGAVMVSGIFDLEPLRFSNLQPQLQLDDGVIRRNSPLFHVSPSPTPMLVAWGADESSEIRQAVTNLCEDLPRARKRR